MPDREVKNGPVYLWATPSTKRNMRIAFAALMVGSAVAGALVGYAIGRRKKGRRR